MNRNDLELELTKHHHDAYWWAVQCCNYEKDHGQEVLQQVYLKVLEGRARFKGKSRFKTWLFSVIRFTAIDYLKGHLKLENLDSQSFKVESKVDVDKVDYKQLINKLPERQKQVLLLKFYHDLTLKEIGEVMDIHLGTVSTHYERGKDALRKMINEEMV